MNRLSFGLCFFGCWVGVLVAGDVAAVSANPRHGTTADASESLLRSIDRETQRLVRDSVAGARTAQSTSTQLRKCTSPKKGAVIGAVLGGVAAAVFGAYVSEPHWGLTMGGAGIGAFFGYTYCL